jgi:hypothetical protein
MVVSLCRVPLGCVHCVPSTGHCMEICSQLVHGYDYTVFSIYIRYDGDHDGDDGTG